MLSRYILNLWDPESRYRDGDARITVGQVITAPAVCIGLLFTLPIDMFIVIFVLRLGRDED